MSFATSAKKHGPPSCSHSSLDLLDITELLGQPLRQLQQPPFAAPIRVPLYDSPVHRRAPIANEPRARSQLVAAAPCPRPATQRPRQNALRFSRRPVDWLRARRPPAAELGSAICVSSCDGAASVALNCAQVGAGTVRSTAETAPNFSARVWLRSCGASRVIGADVRSQIGGVLCIRIRCPTIARFVATFPLHGRHSNFGSMEFNATGNDTVRRSGAAPQAPSWRRSRRTGLSVATSGSSEPVPWLFTSAPRNGALSSRT